MHMHCLSALHCKGIMIRRQGRCKTLKRLAVITFGPLMGVRRTASQTKFMFRTASQDWCHVMCFFKRFVEGLLYGRPHRQWGLVPRSISGSVLELLLAGRRTSLPFEAQYGNFLFELCFHGGVGGLLFEVCPSLELLAPAVELVVCLMGEDTSF